MEFNFSDIHEAIAAAVPDREAIIWRDRRITHARLADRSRRLANYLLERGLSLHKERRDLAGHESGQDHVALYLYNGNEYIEGMLGAWKARLAALNVNYRYVEEELLYLFDNSRAKAIIYHSEFADRVAAIRDRCPNLEVLIQVSDESGAALLPGAVDYEEALASASAELPRLAHSGDDLYILYTGGTTGMPKGVLWRSHDIFMAAMGGRKMDGTVYRSIEEIVETVKKAGGMNSLVGPPLMHGAAQWACFIMMTNGASIVLPNIVDRMDADDFLSTVEREKCVSFSIVGDAFARPLLDQMVRKTYDLSGVFIVGSGGAPLSTTNKEKFLRYIPGATVIDTIGSSETGAQGSKLTVRETLTLFRSFYRSGNEPDDTLALVRLEEKADVWVRKLSGGQRQRLSLACALVCEPEILFLDEPTTGLDPQARLKIWEIIGDFRARGGTVLLTTHYMEEAHRLCDRVAIIDQGKMIALGTPSQLIGSLGAEHVVEFEVEGSLDAGRLEGLDGVRKVARENGAFRLTVDHVHRAIPALLDRLRGEGRPLSRLTTHHATLEDVFVSLTGRHLREE